ncbi:MAG: hypothetical protein ACPK7O_09995 [Methanobacterium sp.]
MDIQKDMENLNSLEMEMQMGEEKLIANFKNNEFSISSLKNKELEIEVIDEINQQVRRKHPKTCPQFLKRIYK